VKSPVQVSQEDEPAIYKLKTATEIPLQIA
jgi:hypothetical protein